MPSLIDLTGLPRERQWVEYYRLMSYGNLSALVAIGRWWEAHEAQDIAWSTTDDPNEWSPVHV